MAAVTAVEATAAAVNQAGQRQRPPNLWTKWLLLARATSFSAASDMWPPTTWAMMRGVPKIVEPREAA